MKKLLTLFLFAATSLGTLFTFGGMQSLRRYRLHGRRSDAAAQLRRPQGHPFHGDCRLDTNFFSVRKRSCEAVEKAVSKAFLKEVHAVILKHDLPRRNGFDVVTSGLPVQYSSCSLSVDYASGERLYFHMDGDPEAEWARQLKTLFLREISANGTPINPSV